VMILWHRATDGAATAIRGIFDGVGQTVGNFFSGLGTITRKALDFWGGLWTQFAASPARAIGFVVGFVVGGFARIVQFLEEFRLNTNRALTGFLQGAVGKVVTFFTALPGQIGSALGDAFSRLGTFTKQSTEAWGTWLAGIGEAVGAFFQDLPVRFGTWLGESLARFLAFKDQVGTAVGDTVAKVGAVLGEFFTALPGRMFQYGVDMLLGFIGGAKSMFSTVKTTVTEFFEGVVQGVKAVLDSHSPSGVFREIGAGMMLGLAQGIDKNANLPQMAMPELSANIGTGGSRAPFARAPINISVGPLTLNYSGPESPAKVRQMGADTLDYITQGLSDQFNRLAAV
jgi:hypothetical protein